VFHFKSLVLLLVIACGVSVAFAASARAQSESAAWTSPANISQSGAASQARLAAAPDGTLHALWWDSVAGEQYASTTTISSTEWTRPLAMPDIYGRRNEDTQTNLISYSPPRDVQMIATASGDIQAFWLNDDGELYNAQLSAGEWGDASLLAETALAVDVAADANGGTHLVYVRPSDTVEEPAGLYYRSQRNGDWSSPSLVYASPYFRSTKPGNVRASVASNSANQVVVTWDDPQFGNSLYTRSVDDDTWAEPQTVAGAPGSSQHARVAVAPNDEILMLWQDTNSGGCGYLQRRLTAGSDTWTAPQKVLGNLTQCDLDLKFMPTPEYLWLVGRPATEAENAINEVTLAEWNGDQWSSPVNVDLSFFNSTSNRTISLGCLVVSIASETAGLLGCDPTNDVWAARNATPLTSLIPQLQPVWSEPLLLSDEALSAAPNDFPALATSRQGMFFAMWSQQIGDQGAGSALYASAWDGRRWTRTAAVLQSPDRDTSNSKTMQPALTTDAQDKVHALWSSGTNGQIFYSSTYLRDFNSAAAWAEPIELPSVGRLSSGPDIVADPRGADLYAVFAVPLNEQRGIYLARSTDSGTSWISPTLIADAVAAQWDSVDIPRLALDPAADVLHAVWLQKLLPGASGAQAIHYARSTDRGQTWSAPTLIVTGDVDWPRIAVNGPNQVYLAWNQSSVENNADTNTPMRVWGQFSPDGGQRWAAPVSISSLKQVSGPAGLTSDGAGHMYLVAIGQSMNAGGFKKC